MRTAAHGRWGVRHPRPGCRREHPDPHDDHGAGGGRTPYIGGSRLSNATCLTHAFFKSGEGCGKLRCSLTRWTRGRILMSVGKLLESLSQTILAGIMLVGRLGARSVAPEAIFGETFLFLRAQPTARGVRDPDWSLASRRLVLRLVNLILLVQAAALPQLNDIELIAQSSRQTASKLPIAQRAALSVQVCQLASSVFQAPAVLKRYDLLKHAICTTFWELSLSGTRPNPVILILNTAVHKLCAVRTLSGLHTCETTTYDSVKAQHALEESARCLRHIDSAAAATSSGRQQRQTPYIYIYMYIYIYICIYI